jgi:tetratricopeptide (TPR) repeat protein
VSNLLIGLLGALLATNQPAAVSNLVTQTTGVSVSIPDPSDPVEKEFHQLMTDDDAAMDEVDKWIQENNSFTEQGAGISKETLNARIHARLDVIKKSYQDFLTRHPNHARAHIAYGSFLNDIKDEDGAVAEWEKARALDPKNPSPWNELANVYGHDGPVMKAFEYYEKAIQLDPTEPVYYQNLGTTVYLFRRDATNYYHITEQEVFNKALTLYSNAMRLDPQNFELAQDVAQTYYGIRPFRTEDALVSWTNALRIAKTDVERQGVYIHFARIKLNAGRLAEAQQHLDDVNIEHYNELKRRIQRNLDEALAKSKATNAPPAELDSAPKPDPVK